jgi:hypothetical protein
MTNTDCLVLKIEERDVSTGKPDATVFVLYDQKDKCYLVRGQRVKTEQTDAGTYSFTCKRIKDLTNFLSVVICKDNTSSYILYNYDDLPMSSDDITYSSLYSDETTANEIAAYDDLFYNRSVLKRYLGMLRNVFNPYY